MAIIKPSLVFEGSHLGDRNDPRPGYYAAKLHSAQVTPNSNKSYVLEWFLTNHQSTNYRWSARQWFPLKNPGILSSMLLSWKEKMWKHLGVDDQERLQQLKRWIGDEADVRVDFLESSKSRLIVVGEVWPSGSVPKNLMPPHREDEGYL